MLIKTIAEILDGEMICCADNMEKDVHAACASDMMSDVLAFVKDQAVLITGLSNPQVIRTAEMMDMNCVVLVRGKRPDKIMQSLAESKGIVVICTKEKMFSACGKLYSEGLKAGN
ncbi:MAG: hypothetical protein EOM87_00190 [Clostridia bacterium]|nr:hypothetical protein [Clostridia bacterium]